MIRLELQLCMTVHNYMYMSINCQADMMSFIRIYFNLWNPLKLYQSQCLSVTILTDSLEI